MRLFVVHNEAGEIHQVVTCRSDGPITVLTPPTGYFFTECEPPEYLAEDADYETTLEFMNTHRLQGLGRKAMVVRREDDE
jgi:hypothetical protein